MNRRASLAPWSCRTSLRLYFLPAMVLLGLLGCMTPPAKDKRAQSDEDPEKDRYEVKTIGDITTVGNADNVVVAGLGLVVGLEGTGGEIADPDIQQMMEQALRKKGEKNTKELLHSTSTAIVQVTGIIAAGCRKGEPFDVEVSLPPHTKATSLRGGYLTECKLYNYDQAKRIDPKYKGPENSLQGTHLGTAAGPVLVGMAEGDEQARSRKGRLWAGGKTQADMSMMLLLNSDYRYAITSQQVAMRINELFLAGQGNQGDTIALPQAKLGVAVRVPAQYRLNVSRFLRVVRLIPNVPVKPNYKKKGAKEVVEKTPPPAANKPEIATRTYQKRLADDLLDPSRTVVAALRLEALGRDSIPVLLEGLKSKDSLVRFCSAESLAYLGSPSAGDELAQAVSKEPMLRAFGLTALASLDEAVSHVKLEELLANSTDDETRYGAFRALRALDETNLVVKGELLNDSFYLHQVARNSLPMVHLSTTRRAEVVIFGPDPVLLPPFSFLAGDFVVTATIDDEQRCTVSRIPPKGGETERRQCPLKLTSLLRTLAAMGAQYPEVIAILQDAHLCERMTSKLRLDALPQATTVYELAEVGKSGVPLTTEGSKAVPDLGATPNLYDNAKAPRKSPWVENENSFDELPIGPESKEAQRVTPEDE